MLDLEKLALVKDEHLRMSLELQAVFGLRCEEAIKFTPAYADRGDRVRIKASWAKGGRGRSRSGTSTSAECSTPPGALRAPARSSRAGAATPRSASSTSGKPRRRGFRACTGCAYAQACYEALTGWKAPTAGCPRRRSLEPAKRRVDKAARMTIARELGHGRLEGPLRPRRRSTLYG